MSTSDTMQALAVTVLSERAELIEMPRPTVGDDEVLIKTWYSGVSVGTEMWIATGKRKDYGEVPFVNGYQATGEIVAIGAAVQNHRVGDAVVALCSGAHSEYVIGHSDYVFKMANSTKAQETALWVQVSVSANALNMASVSAGDTVLVVGQGLIGQTTARLARLRGAYVITSDIAPERLEISANHCADWVIDASEGKVSEKVRGRFPEGVDVVLESTGFQNLLDDALLCCTDNGRFVFEGWYPNTVTFDYMTPHRRQVRAFFPTSIGPIPTVRSAIRLIEAGFMEMKPLISHLVPWKGSAECYNRLFTAQRNQFNGIVFDWKTA